MTFQNYVCWNPKQLQKVMNVEATQSEDHIFLATHHPLQMKRSELIRGDSFAVTTEEEILKDFLATDDFAFVPVLGQSGTGKSHLVRWLSAKIESTEKRKVLLIPKLGTNLKNIIEMILSLPDLEGEQFKEYRQRLTRATGNLSVTEAKEQLLNQLAIAVGENEQRDQNQLTEEQEYLIEELDAFLYDPYFRKYWLKEEGIIHRLVIHTLGNRTTLEETTARREFALDDLPLSLQDVNKAGKQAEDFYRTLVSDEELQEGTVNWLNQHLDEAIARVLDLAQEDLLQLMQQVRISLAEKDIELVLLIEDFAKFQGIDREVLEAILARPQQAGNKPLCAMRTALACTTGYFESLIDTVQQRVTFSVNLDLGNVNNQSYVTKADIQQLASRYLNAVRLPETELKNWLEEQKNLSNQEEPPSFCEQCEHREACHQGFGEVNGMGLYPFTPQALTQMLSRVSSNDNFNPRVLIRDVLKYILEHSVTPIQEGEFPTKAIQEHFGRRLNTILQDEIQQKDSSNAERREVFIDLWSDSDKLCNLPPQVHTAFNLPQLNVNKTEETKTKPVVREDSTSGSYNKQPSPKKKQYQEIPEKLKKQLDILKNWNNQEILDQDTAKPLREFIYPAVLERIQWNTEMLLQGSFAGSNSIFKQRNVIFYTPRVTRETLSGIVLKLPLNPEDNNEFLECTIALQGILQYQYYQHWNFPNGTRYFRAYAKQLEKWRQHVIEQINRYPRESGEVWDPVPATVELLAIAAKMSGHPTNSIENLINSLFLELEDKDEDSRAKTWKQLFKVFKDNRNHLFEILKSRIGCTKGSNRKYQIIDTVQILDPLKAVRKDWKLQCEIPNDLKSKNQPYKALAKVREEVDKLLNQAIEEERDRQLAVYENLIAEFGEDVKKDAVITAINQAIEKSREAGVFSEKNVEQLNDVIDRFKRTRFKGYLDTMKRIKEDTNNADISNYKLINYLGDSYQKPIQDASEFLDKTQSFLDNSLSKAEREIENLQNSGGETVEASHKQIKQGLSDLRMLLQQLQGE
jgi:energy-coupling factor transporter ATP-binding protein EcfA2